MPNVFYFNFLKHELMFNVLCVVTKPIEPSTITKVGLLPANKWDLGVVST